MRLFFTAFQFLTIIPLPFTPEYRDGDLGKSMGWFPLVGLLIGVLLAGLGYVLQHLLPPPIVVLLQLAALAAVTGALHMDGLADVFDGFGARGGRERFLAVMKDSGIGAIGATALFLAIMVKYQALLHLPAASASAATVLFPAFGRFSQVVMTVGARTARPEGLGSCFIAGAGFREVVAAAATILVTSGLLLGAAGIVCCLATAGFTWVSRQYFHRRLGGITGDIIGCTSELAEILALLAVIAYGSFQRVL